jgi:RNA polymerase sigma factor for flagellar operon FliA
MILQNLPLVTFVVSKMAEEAGGGLDREDALAYGVEGLIQTVDSFDPSRGTTFASFAIRRIRGAILDASRKMDHLPRSLRKGARELERATVSLAAQLGRWPTEKELAMRLGLRVDRVRSLIGYSGSRVVSLERIMAERASEGSAPWEAPDPDELADPAMAVEKAVSLNLLEEAMRRLAPRERLLIRLRYRESMPFHEIGKVIGLSESRVCQLHKRILSQLRRQLEETREAAA